jgi:hypothetical protein
LTPSLATLCTSHPALSTLVLVESVKYRSPLPPLHRSSHVQLNLQLKHLNLVFSSLLFNALCSQRAILPTAFARTTQIQATHFKNSLASPQARIGVQSPFWILETT